MIWDHKACVRFTTIPSIDLSNSGQIPLTLNNRRNQKTLVRIRADLFGHLVQWQNTSFVNLEFEFNSQNVLNHRREKWFTHRPHKPETAGSIPAPVIIKNKKIKV